MCKGMGCRGYAAGYAAGYAVPKKLTPDFEQLPAENLVRRYCEELYRYLQVKYHHCKVNTIFKPLDHTYIRGDCTQIGSQNQINRFVEALNHYIQHKDTKKLLGVASELHTQIRSLLGEVSKERDLRGVYCRKMRFAGKKPNQNLLLEQLQLQVIVLTCMYKRLSVMLYTMHEKVASLKEQCLWTVSPQHYGGLPKDLMDFLIEKLPCVSYYFDVEYSTSKLVFDLQELIIRHSAKYQFKNDLASRRFVHNLLCHIANENSLAEIRILVDSFEQEQLPDATHPQDLECGQVLRAIIMACVEFAEHNAKMTI